MEEALKCRAIATVMAELRRAPDLTATRRLSLAARDGGGLGLLLCHKPNDAPSAARTRWQRRAAPSVPDEFGGLGRTAFTLSLRATAAARAATGLSSWDHHECAFRRYLSVWLRRLSTDRIASAPRRLNALVIVGAGQECVAALRRERRRGCARPEASACRSPTRARCIRGSRSRRPTRRPTSRCSKRSPTGATAIRRWSGSMSDGLTLDITGCAHLFGGETALARDLKQRLGAHGLQARLAVAGTVGCAWGVARLSAISWGSLSARRETRSAPLPLAALRLDPETSGARPGRLQAHRRRARPAARAARRALRRDVRAPDRPGARHRGRADHAAPAGAHRDHRAALSRADRA